MPGNNVRARLLDTGPFRFGFVTTLGVLLALLLGSAIASLSTALTLIFVSLFISLGLSPTVQRLERRGLGRTGAVLIVLSVFILLVGVLTLLVVPIVAEQAGAFGRYVPQGLDGLAEADWFRDADAMLGGALTPALEWLENGSEDPNVWLALGGGALRVGAGIFNGLFAVVFVVVLTLYFVASLETIKASAYALVPASKRPAVVDLSETIALSVGKYLGGMVILAAMNAVFTFILLSVMGVRYAAILAVFAFPITLIPLVGSVVSLTVVTTVSLFTSPSTAIIVFLVMLLYIQIESYVLTPRVVGKAISIPASLVLIGALVGGTLLGLLGALIACPTTASILLILKKVVIPAQERR